MRTGFAAARFGIAAFIIPFIFVYTPPHLMDGAVWEILLEFSRALIGLGALSVSINGFLYQKIDPVKCVIIGFASLCILLPENIEIHAPSKLINSAGIIITAIMFVTERMRKRASRLY